MLQPAIFAPPKFGIRESAPGIEPSVLEKRLEQYMRDWNRLISRNSHLLQEVNLNTLEASARRFLTRQANTNPSNPVPFVIGLAGGTASGKTTTKKQWMSLFPKRARQLSGWKKGQHGPLLEEIELDQYYKDSSAKRKLLGDAEYFRRTNLDSPKAVNLHHAFRDILKLKNGKAVYTPFYCFFDSSLIPNHQLKIPAPFVLVEGIFALVPASLRKLMDLKIFLATDKEIQAKRWWQRAPEREHSSESKVSQDLFRQSMEMHDIHVEPSRRYADVVLNTGASENDVNKTLKAISGLLLQTFYPPKH